jgi:hypothetical protein
MRHVKQTPAPLVYDDCWLYDLKSEKWHKLKLSTYSVCVGAGKRMGHTLSPIYSQSSSAVLFGGGPDIQKMQMCNDAFIIDLRMPGSLPAASPVPSPDADSSQFEASPYLLQPGSVPWCSIAPRMFHTLDAIDESQYLLFGGYARHRTCSGLWTATVINCELSQREKQRKKGKLKTVMGADGLGGSVLQECAEPSQLYHHLPFTSSPFRPADPGRLAIKEVVMKKESEDKLLVIAPEKKNFPAAFERDPITTGTLPRSSLLCDPDAAPVRGTSSIDPLTVCGFVDATGEPNRDVLEVFIDYVSPRHPLHPHPCASRELSAGGAAHTGGRVVAADREAAVQDLWRHPRGLRGAAAVLPAFW